MSEALAHEPADSMASSGFGTTAAFADEHAPAESKSTLDGPLRLDVLAADVADVVESAGGWVYDRVRIGWTVNVYLVDDANAELPLRILGAHAHAMTRLPVIAADDARPHSVAASSTVLRHDRSVRADVMAALKRPTRRVFVWGDSIPSVGHRFVGYTHHLSPGAQAFKARALLTIGRASVQVSAVETLGGRARMLDPCDADLVATADLPRGSTAEVAAHAGDVSGGDRHRY